MSSRSAWGAEGLFSTHHFSARSISDAARLVIHRKQRHVQRMAREELVGADAAPLYTVSHANAV